MKKNGPTLSAIPFLDAVLDCRRQEGATPDEPGEMDAAPICGAGHFHGSPLSRREAPASSAWADGGVEMVRLLA
jgi:hypothetical protein